MSRMGKAWIRARHGRDPFNFYRRGRNEEGFETELTSAVSSVVSVPVIASGGGGKMQDFADVFQKGGADAALAASVFHFGEIEIPQLKQFIRQQGISMRI